VEVVILPTAEAIGTLVADTVTALLARRPDAVLGLSTGSSPLVAYREIAGRHRMGELSFAQARGFLLDEYVGLPPGHTETYRAFIEHELERHVDFAPGAVVGPDGNADDLAAACRAYDHAIRSAGGIDLQLLGIGVDGHIGFNEPGSSLASRTRLKTLTSRTREDNARFFPSPDDVPRHVVTQGIGTILEARHIVLIATGPAKADAVARAVEGPVTAMCPASALQLHPHVSVLLDEDAAAQLSLAPYYREAWAGKPAWQGL
jgi:glucosamine-6-phosphate deaminase